MRTEADAENPAGVEVRPSVHLLSCANGEDGK